MQRGLNIAPRARLPMLLNLVVDYCVFETDFYGHFFSYSVFRIPMNVLYCSNEVITLRMKLANLVYYFLLVNFQVLIAIGR